MSARRVRYTTTADNLHTADGVPCPICEGEGCDTCQGTGEVVGLVADGILRRWLADRAEAERDQT